MPSGFLHSSPSIQRAQRKPQPFSERSIFAVTAPEILLGSLQREKVINDIKQVVNAPEVIFNNLYRSLINQLVRYAQILPVNNEARMGSIMDEGLLRGLFALQVLQRESTKEPEPLISYVVFSASLLFDVGFMTGNRTINLVDKQGTFISNWLPYSGPMTANGYYKIRRGGGVPPWLCRRMAVLLARQIMPQVGFNWIAGDAYALNLWIMLLNNEHEGVESLKLYIDRALELLEEFKASQESLWLSEVDITEAEEVALGEDFIEWLEKIVAEQKVTVNQVDSKIHVVTDGLFIKLPEMLEDFSRQHARNPNPEAVLEQLKKMGFLKLVDGEITIERVYFSPERKGVVAGVSVGAAAAATRMSLFGDAVIGGGAKVMAHAPDASAKIGAAALGGVETQDQKAKESPVYAADRNLGQFGLQTGVIISGPNAGCLVDRINVNFSLPNNNLVRMDSVQVAEQAPSSMSQDANYYPPAAAMVGGMYDSSLSATKVFTAPALGAEPPPK